MKTLFVSLIMLSLLTSCQESNQSKTMPGETTTVTPRVNYRVIALQPRKGGYGNKEYPLMIKDFEDQVNQAITEGWQPLGGVATATTFGVPVQAMMKPE